MWKNQRCCLEECQLLGLKIGALEEAYGAEESPTHSTSMLSKTLISLEENENLTRNEQNNECVGEF